MAATRTPSRAAPAERKRAGHAERRDRRRSGAERTEKLTEDLFEEVEAGQRAAIKAVKRFVDTVDRTLPPQTEGPSGRQTVVDAAMEMADQLVHVQYDFLRKVVRSAGKSLNR
jgi:hypothetical protein